MVCVCNMTLFVSRRRRWGFPAALRNQLFIMNANSLLLVLWCVAGFQAMASSLPGFRDNWVLTRWGCCSKPVRHGWAHQQLGCRRHSFRVH